MSARTEAVSGAMPVGRVVVKHHALVRLSHWLNIPLLLGLIASGLSIYWASPVYERPPDPVTRRTDYLADLVRIGPTADPGWLVYGPLGLGTFRLGQALPIPLPFAYLFMANSLLVNLG